MNPTMNSVPSSQTLNSSSSRPKYIVPLDFNNVPTLPDSHAWTTLPLDDHPPIDPFTEEPFPIIDLAKPGVVNLVRHACEKWGSFQITNHGIPFSFLYEAECQTRRLFSLPMECKLHVVRSPGTISGYSSPRMSTFFPKQMWTEGFSIIGSPQQHASQLWPEDHAKFCEVMEQYQVKMKRLSEKMVAIMLISLGLTHEEDVKWFESKNGGDEATCVLQLNSYPVCPDPARAIGLAPHTDSSLLTLLYQGSVSGLQVYRDGAGWVAVEPVEGTLVVNLGDLMQIISNGKFKSVLHRALVNNTQHRVSMGYFCGPPKDAMVSPLSKFIDYDHPPLYHQVTWKEYLDIKEKHFRNSLESIRL
ncbi:hypothetical protein CRYUN_Cryun26dG0071200 [Craigia yunnanensis]